MSKQWKASFNQSKWEFRYSSFGEVPQYFDRYPCNPTWLQNCGITCLNRNPSSLFFIIPIHIAWAYLWVVANLWSPSLRHKVFNYSLCQGYPIPVCRWLQCIKISLVGFRVGLFAVIKSGILGSSLPFPTHLAVPTSELGSIAPQISRVRYQVDGLMSVIRHVCISGHACETSESHASCTLDERCCPSCFPLNIPRAESDFMKKL